ncbi:MAG: hypothetical protein Q7S09_04660 [bacterium]|nr:hypothetical protein [bacterium]
MDINPPQQNFRPPLPSSSPSSPGSSLGDMWKQFQKSKIFPVASIILVAVIILGLGFAVVGLINRLSPEKDKFAPVKGPENVAYTVAGGAELKLDVLKVEYRDTYNDQKPIAPGRKFVVVSFEILNVGKGPSGPFTNADMRLITPDGSIMPPAGWSSEFLNYGVGAGATKKGEVIFDIDERNSQQALAGYTIAFGQNPGSRAMYQLTPQ